jgi:hypothetical protein
LQRRVRTPKQVEVALTVSENLRGFLLVSELSREKESFVDMAEFSVAPPAPAARPAFTLRSTLLREQDEPILDAAVLPDAILLLDVAGLLRGVEGKWERAASFPEPFILRDPRGRLEAAPDGAGVHVPGMTCSLTLECAPGGPFQKDRNTQDLGDWRGEFFSSAEIGADVLVAHTDGRVRVYDQGGSLQGAIDGWGSDFAVIRACGGPHIAATSTSAADSITLFDLVSRTPVAISEPLEFPGPITALWPSREGALAVTRDPSTAKYAAYSLTIDCGR